MDVSCSRNCLNGKFKIHAFEVPPRKSDVAVMAPDIYSGVRSMLSRDDGQGGMK